MNVMTRMPRDSRRGRRLCESPGRLQTVGRIIWRRNPAKDGRSATEGTITTHIEPKQFERLAIGTHVVYESIRREGEEELRRTASALGWSALAAELSMRFFYRGRLSDGASAG